MIARNNWKAIYTFWIY